MRKFVIVSLSVGLAGPALAEDVSLRPESCERLATIQYNDCEVENQFRCYANERELYRSEFADAYEVYSVEISDPLAGTDNLYFLYQPFGTKLTYSGEAPEDAIRNGRSIQGVTGELIMFGMRRPISGQSTYTFDGKTEEIGGLTFHQLTSEDHAVLPPPMGEVHANSVFLLNEEADLLITKETNFSLSQGSGESTLMVELSLPGQSGFGDEFARYGCGDISRLGTSGEEEKT